MRDRKSSSTAVKILMALVFASVIGGISIVTAFGFYIVVPSGSGVDLAFPGGDCGYYNDCGYYDDGGYYYGGVYGHGGGHGGGGHGGGGRK